MSTYVPKPTRDDVYRFFFTEGVIACKKDRLGTWAGTLGDKTFKVPCVQIMQLMRSLKSRELIKEQFAWQHYYWTLNDAGLAYMREYLHLAVTAVPNTQKPTDVRFEKVRERGEGRGRGGRGEGRGRGGRGEGRGRGGRGRGGRGFGGERREYGNDAAVAAEAPVQEEVPAAQE
ncbi:small subunit ribosomal protein S10e [Angomonas deanei]|uniref:Plectin/S10 domain containing protein, putative n=1 Tax=Angomonas deanei TaxID=59799 RepID=A0A7G2C607_9TRYP|nr:small subunit ribosomal protein S10e [Angomonas deanei]CAD2214186.1 Plectin/S10 domain containing protein, putative [Angomonas deanei]CAD2214187.1 Plectin/S10 domain containing protein, putative [Angomonas deanei]|eukprot:EPY26782.1 small subunit ribosomal protein S10e [Angomonas deanei]